VLDPLSASPEPPEFVLTERFPGPRHDALLSSDVGAQFALLCDSRSADQTQQSTADGGTFEASGNDSSSFLTHK